MFPFFFFSLFRFGFKSDFMIDSNDEHRLWVLDEEEGEL